MGKQSLIGDALVAPIKSSRASWEIKSVTGKELESGRWLWKVS
jgi:hypothetical protein